MKRDDQTTGWVEFTYLDTTFRVRRLAAKGILIQRMIWVGEFVHFDIEQAKQETHTIYNPTIFNHALEALGESLW